jgi:chemotaxis protein methyltransferase CheR
MSSIDVPILRDLLARRTGLDLGRGGMEARLVHFVRQRLQARDVSFERYIEQVENPNSEELTLLTEAMTVVYTWFFRDPGQFHVIEQLIRNFTVERPLGIWVAGCATGEEPYSIALLAAEIGKRVDILGTDLNRTALQHAKTGHYLAASLEAVDPAMRRRFIGDAPGDYRVPELIKTSVRFQVSNLVNEAPRPPVSQGWDLVICRNVLIYFGQQQAHRSLEMLAGSLAPGGALILGASEAILDRPTTLVVAGVAGRAVLVRPRPVQAETKAARPAARRISPCPGDRFATIHTETHASPTPARASARLPSMKATSPALESEPSVQSLIAAGHEALDAGAIPTARDYYLRAISSDPTCADALMFAGITFYLDGAFDQALSNLRGALCMDSTLWPACFYQALCYENMGHAEDAARSYAQVVLLADAGVKRVEHPFLKEWRQDLLVVAAQRANYTAHVRDGRRQHLFRTARSSRR